MAGTLLVNANLVTGDREGLGALAIEGQRIAGLWYREDGAENDDEAIAAFPDAEIIDLEGKVLMAGGIDAHVHFRDPGMTHKADIGSESRAALLGGITSFIDMPNNIPPATTKEAIEAKLHTASEYSWANYGFHIGATNDNAGEIRELLQSGFSHSIAGVKVFMGSSTGNMLVDRQKALDELFSVKEKPILIHSEDEGIIKANLAQAREKYGDDIPFREHPAIRSRKACIMSTIRALSMATEHGTRLHVLHVTTKEEVEMVRAAKIHNPGITAETSANYLWFCDKDYDTLGSKIKCNPAVKEASDRDALRKALEDGLIDTVGSDHAPHLLSEKDKPYASCPSGVPSIENSLSVAFTVGISNMRIAAAYSQNVAAIFRIEDRGTLREGFYADLIVVDPEEARMVEGTACKCGWTPYEGVTLKGAVKMVFLNGELAVKDGRITGKRNAMPLVFD